MIKPSKSVLRDEDEMRAFYKSVGISPEIVELAIIAKRNKPAREHAKPKLLKTKRLRRVRPAW